VKRGPCGTARERAGFRAGAAPSRWHPACTSARRAMKGDKKMFPSQIQPAPTSAARRRLQLMALALFTLVWTVLAIATSL
jgi:hypothetical protein